MVIGVAKEAVDTPVMDGTFGSGIKYLSFAVGTYVNGSQPAPVNLD